jgi:protein-tyrosine phosphatase
MPSLLLSLDATTIAPFVAMGSAPPTGCAVHDAGYSVLVLAARKYQPKNDEIPCVWIVRAPLRDAELTEEMKTIAWSAAKDAARFVRAKQSVLVTCYAGINRSALITALILNETYGLSGREAIVRIRSMRSVALTNASFVSYLRTIPGR